MDTECNNKGYYPAVKGKWRKIAEEISSPEFHGNITALCERHGIARSTYYRKLDDPSFCGYCEWLINKYTDSELANMWRNVIKAGNGGDVQAMKLFFELKGKFKQSIDINGSLPVTIVDDMSD